MNTRTCTGCGKTKPVTEFGKNMREPDGLMKRCRACTNESNRAYRARVGRAKANAWAREWAARNREQTRASQKRWREANKQYKKAYDRRRNQDPEIRTREIERKRAYVEANREKVRERRRRYRDRSRERIREQARKRYRRRHPPKPPLSMREAFELRVERRNGDGTACWKWLGAVANGYPRIRSRSAAQVAWELYVGPVPKWQKLARTCGNQLCTNPQHLRLRVAESRM